MSKRKRNGSSDVTSKHHRDESSEEWLGASTSNSNSNAEYVADLGVQNSEERRELRHQYRQLINETKRKIYKFILKEKKF